MLTIFERAYLPECDINTLPECLTLQELAELRASTLDGFSRETYLRLLERQSNQVKAGALAIQPRITEHWTGNHTREELIEDGPAEHRGKVRTVVFTVSSGPAPGGTVKQFVSVSEQVVSREHASQLFRADPEAWGGGAVKWCGAKVATSVDIPFSPGGVELLKVRPMKSAEAIRELESLGFLSNELEQAINKKPKPWSISAKVPDRHGYYYFDLLRAQCDQHLNRQSQQARTQARISLVGG